MSRYTRGFVAAIILVALAVIRVDTESQQLPNNYTQHTIIITAPHIHIEVSVDTPTTIADQ